MEALFRVTAGGGGRRGGGGGVRSCSRCSRGVRRVDYVRVHGSGSSSGGSGGDGGGRRKIGEIQQTKIRGKNQELSVRQLTD